MQQVAAIPIKIVLVQPPDQPPVQLVSRAVNYSGSLHYMRPVAPRTNNKDARAEATSIAGSVFFRMPSLTKGLALVSNLSA